MRKKFISVICSAFMSALLIGITVVASGCRTNTEQKIPPDTTVTAPDDSSDIPVITAPDKPPEQGTALPIKNPEDWFVPQPVPELDEGNEIYLDADVIGKLTAMDESGQEDLVNAILDGEILLINHFVKKDYSAKALSQIQRFYFSFYDKLKNEDSDILAEKISQCIESTGGGMNGFADRVSAVFEWTSEQDYSYIFESEGCE